MTRIVHMVDTWMARHFTDHEQLTIRTMQNDEIFDIYEDVLIAHIRNVDFEEFRVRVRESAPATIGENGAADVPVVSRPFEGRNYFLDKLERQEREKEEESILQQFRDHPRLDLELAKTTKVFYESIQTI